METVKSVSKDISILYRLGQAFFDTQLSPYQIGSGQQFFLLNIYTHPGLCQNEIGARGGFDKSTITRSLQKLEELHYITRVTDLQDKRILRLYVTEAAIPVIKATKQSVFQWHELLMTDMSEEERRNAEGLIAKMAGNVTNATQKKGLN